jgi:hypothetical protein
MAAMDETFTVTPFDFGATRPFFRIFWRWNARALLAHTGASTIPAATPPNSGRFTHLFARWFPGGIVNN